MNCPAFSLSVPEAIVLASAIVAVALVCAAWALRKLPTAKAAPAPPEEQEYPQSAAGYPVEPSGVPVQPDTPLQVGDTILAPAQGRWWQALIIAIESEDRLRIHYLGWPTKWDESLPRATLQVDLRDAGEYFTPTSQER